MSWWSVADFSSLLGLQRSNQHEKDLKELSLHPSSPSASRSTSPSEADSDSLHCQRENSDIQEQKKELLFMRWAWIVWYNSDSSLSGSKSYWESTGSYGPGRGGTQRNTRNLIWSRPVICTEGMSSLCRFSLCQRLFCHLLWCALLSPLSGSPLFHPIITSAFHSLKPVIPCLPAPQKFAESHLITLLIWMVFIQSV